MQLLTGGLNLEQRKIRKTSHITGILPPLITPFRENGDVDYDAFVWNLNRWNDDPLAGYLVLGSNSETAYLDEGEKLKLIGLTVKTAKKGRLIFAGTGVESTRETIRLTNKAARLGVQAALILTPSFYGGQMNDEALIKHFTSVADASDIPILIYNVPKFTHLNISIEAVRVLSHHPNIIGMKDSLGDVAQLQAFLRVVHSDFNLIVGNASSLYPALSLGIRAGILALANCAPKECVEIHRLFERGEHQKASELQTRMLAVNRAVTETYGVAGLKYASTLMGYQGGSVRSPLVPLNNEQKADLQRILRGGGLLIKSESSRILSGHG